jgi:hypothetical protein
MDGQSDPPQGPLPQHSRFLSPGLVRSDEVYTLTEFKRRVGFRNDAALRSARRKGLKVVYAHGHGYVFGADWLDYLKSVSSPQDSRGA